MRAETVSRTPSTVSHASQATPERQSPVVWFLVIAGIAFVLRLIHLVQLRHNAPLFFLPHMDALYMERAQAAAGSESESVEYDLAVAAYREAIARAGLRRRLLRPRPGALRREEPAGGAGRVPGRGQGEPEARRRLAQHGHRLSGYGQAGVGGRGDRESRRTESDSPAIAAGEKLRPRYWTPRGRRAVSRVAGQSRAGDCSLDPGLTLGYHWVPAVAAAGGPT